MAKLYYENDADSVPGPHAQGGDHRLRLPGPRARLNLRDSGVDVRVGLRAGSSSTAKAEAAGLRVVTVGRGGAPRPTSS